MAISAHPVQAQLWLRPPYINPVKLTARPPPLVEQGKRRSAWDRWLLNKQRQHNCSFLIAKHLAGQDDTWPRELRSWPDKVSSWGGDPNKVAKDLLRWYPEEQCLVNAAAWLQQTHTSYPDAHWYCEPSGDACLQTISFLLSLLSHLLWFFLAAWSLSPLFPLIAPFLPVFGP